MLTDVVIANKSYTKLNLSENSRVDDIALRVVRQDCPDFLLPMKTMEIDGEMEIRYELQEGIRLSYMSRQMSKKEFSTMIVNMLMPFRSCNDWFLDYHNFLLEENYILVGKNGQSIKYVYIPSPEYANSDEKIKDFFTTLILKTDIIDDPGYLVSALRIIKNQDSNLITLLEYFQKQSSVPGEPEKPAQAALAPQAPQRPVSGLLGGGTPGPQAPLHVPPVSAAPNPFKAIMPEKKSEPPKPAVQERAPEHSTGAFGKSDEQGRLMDSLFGDSDEPERDKEAKGQGLFGWKKGKPKEEKEKKKPEKRGLFGDRGKNDNRGRAPLQPQGRTLQSQQQPQPRLQQQPQSQPQPQPQTPQYQYQQYQGMGEMDDSTTIVDVGDEVSDNSVLKLRLEDCSGCNCPEFVEIDLSRGFATVGRMDKNGVPQADFNFDASVSFVSRRHFRVEICGDHWQLIDLESGNGTFVNQSKLVPNMPCPLNQNDVIMINCNRRRLVYRVC